MGGSLQVDLTVMPGMKPGTFCVPGKCSGPTHKDAGAVEYICLIIVSLLLGLTNISLDGIHIVHGVFKTQSY